MATVVGILALQGDVAEHAKMLQRCGADTLQVRHAPELDQVSGLVIPGGESTTIDKLTHADTMFDAIQKRVARGLPVFGTCMGAIFLAKEIEGSKQGRLGLMDMKVRRNAFGQQKASHQRFLSIPALGSDPVEAVFIRAPLILSCGPGVEVLSRDEEGIMMARQGNMLAAVFHPELTPDTRIHRYFLSMFKQP